ncbi:MAG TPA: porphobilinogen synthase [Verrucomicrobiae bacterium]|nr:porphobilinogen synthase [Verrucomicrobiae bacterium]
MNVRPRRLRRTPVVRSMIRENHVRVDALVMPMFVVARKSDAGPISSMPGISRFTLDQAVAEAQELHSLGVRSVLLFGIPDRKDAIASSNYDPDGIVQRTIGAIKTAVPQAYVIADLCNCEYTDHGHCGIVDEHGDVDNDKTVELLVRTALTYAQAGVDCIAPSDMMDGRVEALRHALDAHGFTGVTIMAYSAKYASAFYGPFREAADSTPRFGDRRSYQMDPPNAREAMREMTLDIEEGADVIMVKPALPYLDIVRMARDTFDVPIAVYNVSGEYSMVQAAIERGWLERERTIDELLVSFVRAGADVIITYFAKEYAKRADTRT